MKRLALIGLLMVAGCQTSAAPETKVSTASAPTPANRSEEGWHVSCQYDQFKAERRCWTGTFGEKTPGLILRFFQVSYTNGKGPSIWVPHDFPGRVATVRVDNGPVVSVTDASRIVEQLKAGTTAYVVFHVWPDGQRKMIVNLTGFNEAYAELQKTLAGG